MSSVNVASLTLCVMGMLAGYSEYGSGFNTLPLLYFLYMYGSMTRDFFTVFSNEMWSCL